MRRRADEIAGSCGRAEFRAQSHIEALESVLNVGLELPDDLLVELDVSVLLRTDTSSRYAALKDAVSAGWLAPNEARSRENLPPVPGGDTPYLQQQNFSLTELAKRDAKDDPFTGARAVDSSPPP